MEDKKTEETIENPVKEEITEEKTSIEEGETSKKTEGDSSNISELEEKNKKLYARTKKAEEDLKIAKVELEKSKTPQKPEGDDVWKAKVNFLLKNRDKNYSEGEFGHISVIAQEQGISLDDAAKSEEDYIQYKREKVESEKSTPEPTTKQSPSEKPFRKVTPEDLGKMTLEQKEDYFKKMGWTGGSIRR